ncbi:hypothetical protein BD413DRAFT_610337 [Trametes elegans]|nr:hypothetical protein BD413DRAFT_610337 [Trametes elegans]
MFSKSLAIVWVSLLSQSLVASASSVARDDTPTNLPPPSLNGSFTAQASTVIDAPIDKVWNAVLDVTKYPEWNSVIRNVVVTDAEHGWRVKNQSAPIAEGEHLILQIHNPPTMDDTIPTYTVTVDITAIEPDLHLFTYVNQKSVIKTDRAQVLSTTEENKTLYVTREVYEGQSDIDPVTRSDYQKGAVAQAEGLKAYVETH